MRMAKKDKKEKEDILRTYGHIPGYAVGYMFPRRRELCSIHNMTFPIALGPEGPFSILLLRNKNLNDQGVLLGFTTGESQVYDEKNMAPTGIFNKNLLLSEKSRLPIRIIRSSFLNTEFSPYRGFRYDGLYTVFKSETCVIKNKLVYKFALERVKNQDPAPFETSETSACLSGNQDTVEITDERSLSSMLNFEVIHDAFCLNDNDFNDIEGEERYCKSEVVEEERKPLVSNSESIYTVQNNRNNADDDTIVQILSNSGVISKEISVPLGSEDICPDRDTGMLLSTNGDGFCLSDFNNEHISYKVEPVEEKPTLCGSVYVVKDAVSPTSVPKSSDYCPQAFVDDNNITIIADNNENLSPCQNDVEPVSLFRTEDFPPASHEPCQQSVKFNDSRNEDDDNYGEYVYFKNLNGSRETMKKDSTKNILYSVEGEASAGNSSVLGNSEYFDTFNRNFSCTNMTDDSDDDAKLSMSSKIISGGIKTVEDSVFDSSLSSEEENDLQPTDLWTVPSVESKMEPSNLQISFDEMKSYRKLHKLSPSMEMSPYCKTCTPPPHLIEPLLGERTTPFLVFYSDFLCTCARTSELNSPPKDMEYFNKISKLVNELNSHNNQYVSAILVFLFTEPPNLESPNKNLCRLLGKTRYYDSVESDSGSRYTNKNNYDPLQQDLLPMSDILNIEYIEALKKASKRPKKAVNKPARKKRLRRSPLNSNHEPVANSQSSFVDEACPESSQPFIGFSPIDICFAECQRDLACDEILSCSLSYGQGTKHLIKNDFKGFSSKTVTSLHKFLQSTRGSLNNIQ